MRSSFWQRSGRCGLIGLGVGLIIFGLAIFLKEPPVADVEFFETQDSVKGEIVIDLAGAVVKPGVYRIKNGFRLDQAISLAGGFSSQADMDLVNSQLNLAREVNDGEKIYIPEKEAAVSRIAGAKTSLININLASLSELDSLAGIGPSFAQKIIDYRQAHGGFKTIEEIMAVAGIGKKSFEKIKDQITI